MNRTFGSADGGRRGALFVGALVAAVVGVVVIAIAVVAQQPVPPQPPAPDAAGQTPQSSPPAGRSPSAGTPSAPSRAGTEPPPASRPVSISIPAIDVQSKVFGIGKAPDGTLAVPQPGPNLNKAAWFTKSPTPGQPGPSVIEGHVATEQDGPSVFFRLGELRRGDKIEVTREDGRVVTFTVRQLETFPKNKFPTMRVYGGNLGTPSLRLITCSDFDEDVGTHTDNLIVFATMTQVRG